MEDDLTTTPYVDPILRAKRAEYAELTSKAFKAGYKEVYQGFVKTALRSVLDDEEKDARTELIKLGIPSEAADQLVGMREFANKPGRGGGRAGDWFLVTISPPVDDLDALHLVLNDFLDRIKSKDQDLSYRDQAVWTFEQRSSEPPASGYHIHMLINGRIDASHRRTPKQIYDWIVASGQKVSVFPKFVPDTKLPFKGSDVSRSIVNVKDIKPGTEADALNYLLGFKADESKAPAVAYNAIWRGELGLEAVYYGEQCPFKPLETIDEE